MNFAELKARLQNVRIDLDALHAEFVQQYGDAALDHLLAYLHQRGVIDLNTLCAHLTGEPVEVAHDVFDDQSDSPTSPPPSHLAPGDSHVRLSGEVDPRKHDPLATNSGATDSTHGDTLADPPPPAAAKVDKTKVDDPRATRHGASDQTRHTLADDVPPAPEIDPEATQSADPSATHSEPGGPQDQRFRLARSDRKRYALLARLGAGSMGEVYLAKDFDLRRKVAFKQMLPDVVHSRRHASRFLSEVQITAQLDHPNIVPVYDVDVDPDGKLGYSMKLVQGKTLKRLITETRERYEQRRPLDEEHQLASRLDLFLLVCEAMAYAHSKGVIHRDLKPENVMLGAYNQVYVMDWGICRLIGAADGFGESPHASEEPPAAPNVTVTGCAVGTPCYMSPEQAAAESSTLDGRSDQYALGLILFELVTLTRAVAGATVMEVLKNILHGRLNPLVHAAGEPIPAALAAIITKATSLRREDRYPSVSALAEDVRRFLHGEAVSVVPDTFGERAMRWMAQHREATLTTTLTILAIGAIVTIGSLWMSRRALSTAQLHEQRMRAFLGDVVTHCRQVDHKVADYELELTRLAGRTAALLAAPTPASPEKSYLAADFRDPEGNQPPDLALLPLYAQPVSFGWPAFKLAPGVTPAAVAGELARLASLRTSFPSVLAGESVASPAALRGRVAQGEAPFRWVYVSLASGIHCGYPGKGSYAEDYDGRTRPFYTRVKPGAEPQWGLPYVDAQGQGLMVSCSVPIYGPQEQLAGVAGCDMTCDYLMNKLLAPEHLPLASERYLVDRTGRIVVDGESARDRLYSDGTPTAEGAVTAAALPYLQYKPVVQAIVAGERGHLEVHDRGHKVIAFYPLYGLEWYYVVVADGRRLFQR